MAANKRHCGSCRECCVALEVTAVDKPAGIYCDLLCATGCSIYEKRPDECREFDCLWLEGNLPKWMKPNLTHAVPWRNGVNGPNGQTIPILRLSFNPKFKRNKRVMRFAKNVSRRMMVILSGGNESECMIDGEIKASKRSGSKDIDMKLTVTDGKITGVETV